MNFLFIFIKYVLSLNYINKLRKKLIKIHNLYYYYFFYNLKNITKISIQIHRYAIFRNVVRCWKLYLKSQCDNQNVLSCIRILLNLMDLSIIFLKKKYIYNVIRSYQYEIYVKFQLLKWIKSKITEYISKCQVELWVGKRWITQ